MCNSQLIISIRSGSKEAFDEMCGLYYAPMMAYARLFLKSSWAQDVVQDVFVNVWAKREMLDEKQSLYGYLLKSVYNQSINYINKHKNADKYRSHYQEQIENMGRSYYDPDQSPIIKKLYNQDLKANIYAAIDSLPPKCGEVFKMSYIDNMSHKDISEHLGIAQSTVENHIYLALKQLRLKLSRDELLALLLMIGILH